MKSTTNADRDAYTDSSGDESDSAESSSGSYAPKEAAASLHDTTGTGNPWGDSHDGNSAPSLAQTDESAQGAPIYSSR